jgi:hypothetical protein
LINIKLDQDFKNYAIHAKKLLVEEDCAVTFSSCGKSIVNQLKIVSALEESLPGLHIVSNIKLTECKTCINRLKKYSKEIEDFRKINDEKVSSYVANIVPTEPEGPVRNINLGPFSHSCLNSRSFPRLILFQQRLSLNLEILKVLPDFAIGYKKPAPPSPIEVPFKVILADYEQDEFNMLSS